MRINSVPDVKCFCNNKNVLCAQSMVWHFVRHPVYARRHIHYYLIEQMQLHCSIFSENVNELFNFLQMASFSVDVHKTNGCPKYHMNRNNNNSKH